MRKLSLKKLSEYPILHNAGVPEDKVYAVPLSTFDEFVKSFGLTLDDVTSCFDRQIFSAKYFDRQRGETKSGYIINGYSQIKHIAKEDMNMALLLFPGYDGKFYGKKGAEVSVDQYINDMISILLLRKELNEAERAGKAYEYITENHERIDEFIDDDYMNSLKYIELLNSQFSRNVDIIKLDNGFNNLIESGVLVPIKPNTSVYIDGSKFSIYFTDYYYTNCMNFKYKEHIIRVNFHDNSKHYWFGYFHDKPISCLYSSVYNSVIEKYEKMGIKKPNNISIGKGTEKKILFTIDYIVSTEDKVRKEMNRRIEERKTQRQKLLDAGFSCSPFESFAECTEHNIGNKEKWTKYEDDRDLYVTLDIDNSVSHSFIQHRIDYNWPV